MRRLLPILLPLLSAAACFGAVYFWMTQSTRFALRVVEAARSPAGIPAEMVDAELVEQVRRIELVRRLSLDTADPARLLAALHGEAGPDKQYPPEQRPQKQRERAARNLDAKLTGRCKARRFPEGGATWVARITGPGQAALPDEAVAAQKALRLRLAGAESVRVVCDSGDLGMLLVKDQDGHRRVAEIFPTHPSQFGISPFSPSMK